MLANHCGEIYMFKAFYFIMKEKSVYPKFCVSDINRSSGRYYQDIISPYNPSPTYPSSMKSATAQQNSTTITEPAVQIRENLQTVMLILLMFLMRRNKLCYKSHSNICDLYCINNSTNWCLQNWQIANDGCTFLSVNFIRTNWIEDLRTT